MLNFYESYKFRIVINKQIVQICCFDDEVFFRGCISIYRIIPTFDPQFQLKVRGNNE